MSPLKAVSKRVEVSTYKEVVGNLSSFIFHDINHLKGDNFPVGT